eukprot:gb/GEZN01010649.1/.p1 GENE.gb/GEZN01010649.1/~~gb/GEZN01010649.1/.p1  ORF type:complete len:219 (-),score=16.61 gb/GEZN01010649.1/:549-1205(-)
MSPKRSSDFTLKPMLLLQHNSQICRSFSIAPSGGGRPSMRKPSAILGGVMMIFEEHGLKRIAYKKPRRREPKTNAKWWAKPPVPLFKQVPTAPLPSDQSSYSKLHFSFPSITTARALPSHQSSHPNIRQEHMQASTPPQSLMQRHEPAQISGHELGGNTDTRQKATLHSNVDQKSNLTFPQEPGGPDLNSAKLLQEERLKGEREREAAQTLSSLLSRR